MRIFKYFLFIFIVSQIVLIWISRIELKKTLDIRILHINDLFDLNPLEKNFVLYD